MGWCIQTRRHRRQQVLAQLLGAAKQARQAGGIKQYERTGLLETRRERPRHIDDDRRRDRRGIQRGKHVDLSFAGGSTDPPLHE